MKYDKQSYKLGRNIRIITKKITEKFSAMAKSRVEISWEIL